MRSANYWTVLLPAALLALATPTIAADSFVGSMSVLGQTNRELADGSALLERGDVQRGLRLTQSGLQSATLSREERAAGESNLCGAYAALRNWDTALTHCLVSIELDPNNWRAYNNRAACYVGRGEYDRALADVETALGLAPGSATLKLSLQIVLDHRRVSRDQAQRARKS